MEIRTDPAGVVLDQLITSRDITRERLRGLTDAEYFWEPAPNMWSVRRRDETKTKDAYGTGDWVVDFVIGEPDPAPLTTIAWRLGHLTTMFEMRWEWTFGGRTQLEDSFKPSATASEALDQLWFTVDRWVNDVGALRPEQVAEVGLSQFPHGLDPRLPFIGIMWWVNREFIHHAAEVALLRDLHASGVGR